MSKTTPTATRKTSFINTNIGYNIIFCGCKVAKYYFDYFADILKKNIRNKFNDVVIVEMDNSEIKLLEFADAFLDSEKNNRKYSNYKKYIVFECETSLNIQKEIRDVGDSNREYESLVFNSIFEIWLLMHFEYVGKQISIDDVYMKLSNHLGHRYIRDDRSTISEIIENGCVNNAINNAKKLSDRYLLTGNDIYNNIEKMIPYTNVYTIVEQFLIVMNERW